MQRMLLKRMFFILLGCVGLLLVYVGQEYLDFYAVLIEWKLPQKLNYGMQNEILNKPAFVFNKTLRYFVNDFFAIAIIYGLFQERKYIRFAFYVMIFGQFFLHPTYLLLRFTQPVGFSSAISHLHRIIMNPVLMMILIPAFYFQKWQGKQLAE